MIEVGFIHSIPQLRQTEMETNSLENAGQPS